MPRNSTVEEGERISIYISKEVKEHLLGVSNISEHIRNLILEATDAGDKVKITKEIVELKERRLRIEADLMELDAMIAKQNQRLDKITRNDEYYLNRRREYLDQWKKVPGYHGAFFPNLSWFEARMDVIQECGFKSPEEALNWFTENHKVRL